MNQPSHCFSSGIHFALLWLLSLAALPAQEPATAAKPVSRAEFGRWMTELSNWGRWGKADQLGALNLVTPQKRKRALRLVREGVVVSLARDVEKEKAVDNGSPFIHVMDRDGITNAGFSCADTFKVSYHGMAHTHIDSLCHMFFEGKMYNGFAQTNVTSQGALRLGIGNLKQGIVTRGVLIDVPALRGVEFVEPGTPICPEELDAWEKKTKTKVAPGDVVLIRTGRWARRAAVGPWSGQFAGLHASCARWLKARDVAVLGSDAASDVVPPGVEGVSMPLHQLCLIAMGTWILDNCDLEALSAAAKQRNRWEFLLLVSPLAVEGGTGSPVNPLAVF
ncbi:MAG TPA: cyclase family protein [Candidatus Binatia bacterium]|jgi:kynurenine formamidase|nr:cyclase family protein [Candidatus Binatia bacterium]